MTIDYHETNPYSPHDVTIHGRNGKNMLLHAFPNIVNTNEQIRLNTTGPILIQKCVVVHASPTVTYESKHMLTCLIAHGEVINGIHTLIGGISSYEFYQQTSDWLVRNGLPPIDCFFSCDNAISGTNMRWDQQADNPVIGVAGIVTDAGINGPYVTLDLTRPELQNFKGISPFGNPNHCKFHQMLGMFKMILKK